MSTVAKARGTDPAFGRLLTARGALRGITKIDVTAAEPIADASCWIELNEPLAMPASSGFASPRATTGSWRS